MIAKWDLHTQRQHTSEYQVFGVIKLSTLVAFMPCLWASWMDAGKQDAGQEGSTWI